jgi:putative hydrolase of the HAD superfamily
VPVPAVISTVVFDADETLVDLRPAIVGALVAVLGEMRRLAPAAAALSVADMDADWAAAHARHPAAPVTVIRRAGLARSLTRVGLESETDRLTDLFFAHRFAASRPYPQVAAVLARLRRAYRLGFATNGNSHTHRVGLGGEFAFEVYAHEDGVPKKPAAGFFAAVVAAAGCDPDSIVHVGDTWEHDVVAPAACGLRTVWLNPSGAPRPYGAGSYPDAEIRALTDLPDALGHLSGAPR